MATQTEQNIQVSQQSTTEGVWTLADYDIDDIKDIRAAKADLLLRLDNEDMSVDQIKQDMAGIFSMMVNVLQNRHLSKKEIEAYAYLDDDGKVYTFFDFKDRFMQYNTKKFLRRICEIAFGQFDHFVVKNLGGGLPTQRINRKKKLSTSSSQSLM